MLAMDWLPFLSRFLHFAVAFHYTDVLNKGEQSPAWHSVMRDDATGCVSTAFYLFCEYPGYGFSTEAFSPQACLDCGVKPLIRLFDEFGFQHSRVRMHIIGYSLGSAIALKLGSEILKLRLGRPSAFPRDKCPPVTLSSMLILAPPTNISECALHVFRVPDFIRPLALSMISKLKTESMNWDNKLNAEDFYELLLQDPQTWQSFKLTVLHGDEDTMVAAWMGQQVVEIGHDMIKEKLSVMKSFETQLEQISTLENLKRRIEFIKVAKGNHLSLLTSSQHQRLSHIVMLENNFLHL
eukprot:Protomagalhaensia_sp_Gyna_25__5675@NODE_803_length_2591_cov_19_859326_g632_i0_p2_GENE_NODE_803_length_2591_cov_19_859326_g632_i0NODE_803_length_2591_cov_19_859326_g632_i0_p2_ORF_typecomplete_len313_score40_32Hydrolase_4/PF12146_8/1_9e07Abhydrolase_6/PF12697_7/2_3e05DUF818/PF05677_12/0_00054Peptidase_S9/PF00326_21/0_11Lipase/PF00151_19/0_059Abhydrolase_2/PF02230_16/8_7e03Abhydrolase_2/PF02230_16/18Abhydrolase_2/PF02230_16/8_2Abhydrolase_1/PF00561_20/0_56DrrA_P4M/PF14860_6/0_16_NODE_803_length_259